MSKINRSDIYDKNLNFLIGSGASVGLLPTLKLALKNSETGDAHTLETLATYFSDDEEVQALIFSYYVERVILPAASFDASKIDILNEDQRLVIENYEILLKSILILLEKKSSLKRANIFTTNYDGLIAHVAEQMIQSDRWDFILNDGGAGFVKRMLQTRNFSRYVKDQGVFDRHERSIPQINLVQPHGSIYWYKKGEQILISYGRVAAKKRIEKVPLLTYEGFEEVLTSDKKTEEDLVGIEYGSDEDAIAAFWEVYEKLPIVNPTKWKFHETVFEEHYYQSLRVRTHKMNRAFKLPIGQR